MSGGGSPSKLEPPSATVVPSPPIAGTDHGVVAGAEGPSGDDTSSGALGVAPVHAQAHVQSHVQLKDSSVCVWSEIVVSRPQNEKVQVQIHDSSAVGCPELPGGALAGAGEGVEEVEEEEMVYGTLSCMASPAASLAPSKPHSQFHSQSQAQSSEDGVPVSVEIDEVTPVQSRERYHSHTHGSSSGIASD